MHFLPSCRKQERMSRWWMRLWRHICGNCSVNIRALIHNVEVIFRVDGQFSTNKNRFCLPANEFWHLQGIKCNEVSWLHRLDSREQGETRQWGGGGQEQRGSQWGEAPRTRRDSAGARIMRDYQDSNEYFCKFVSTRYMAAICILCVSYAEIKNFTAPR